LYYSLLLYTQIYCIVCGMLYSKIYIMLSIYVTETCQRVLLYLLSYNWIPATAPKMMRNVEISTEHLIEFHPVIGSLSDTNFGRLYHWPGEGAQSAPPAPAPQPSAQRHTNFKDYVAHSFMRQIAPATYQIIARSGVCWHNAAQQAAIVAVLRNKIIQHDVYGLAAQHDSLREKSDSGEKTTVIKFVALQRMRRGSIGSFFSRSSTDSGHPHLATQLWFTSRKRYLT
jgi:hypothetical protein